MQETSVTKVQFLDGEDPLEKGLATHSSVLAWRIHLVLIKVLFDSLHFTDEKTGYGK